MTKKGLVILLCIISGLTGLFMSGCGGLFVYWHVVNGGKDDLGAFVPVSIPSLLVGLALTALAISAVVRARRNAREGTEPKVSLPMCILLTLVGAVLCLVGLLFPYLLPPGAVMLWAGIYGMSHATSSKPRSALVSSETPGLAQNPDSSTTSREENRP